MTDDGCFGERIAAGYEDRWAGWDRSPFSRDSESHVSVWRTPPDA